MKIGELLHEANNRSTHPELAQQEIGIEMPDGNVVDCNFLLRPIGTTLVLTPRPDLPLLVERDTFKSPRDPTMNIRTGKVTP